MTYLVDPIRAGGAIATTAAIIVMVVHLGRTPLLGCVVDRVHKRRRIAIPIALGWLAGAVCHALVVVPGPEAVAVGVLSGPVAVFWHELVVESLLGGARSRCAPQSRMLVSPLLMRRDVRVTGASLQTSGDQSGRSRP